MHQPARLYQPGQTKEETIANIKEAIEAYIEALEEDGSPVPEEHFDAVGYLLHQVLSLE